MKLLIADKEQQLLMLLRAYLEDLGHQVEIADRAIQCQDHLRTNSPEVLVLGTLLWGGSETVLAKMAEDEVLRGIPIILLEDPLYKVIPPSLQVIQRITRPIRAGVLAKLLESISHSQQHSNNMRHKTQEQCRASMNPFIDRNAPNPNGISRTSSAG